MTSYFLMLLIALALCLSAQSLALRLVGGRTAKSESNYFSSLGRVQAGVSQPQAKVYFLGSSITGRLPDRAQGYEGTANLGCDGGSAMDTLRVIADGTLPCADTVFIEGNTLDHGIGVGESEMSRAVRSLWFQAGREVPSLAAYSRPSAFPYSYLMARKHANAARGSATPLQVSSSPYIPDHERISDFGREALERLAEIVRLLENIRTGDRKIIIVMLPTKTPAEPDSQQVRLSKAAAFRAGIPFWDFTEGIDLMQISFTDHIHMAPSSAAATAKALLGEISKTDE